MVSSFSVACGRWIQNSTKRGNSSPLLSAVSIPDPRANAERTERVLEGDVPSPANPPEACRFHTRCPYATEICSDVEPQLEEHRRRQWAACHHPLNVGAGARTSDPAGLKA